MASNYGNDPIPDNGLIFCWDPKDKNVFSGAGTTTYDIANNAPGNIGTMRGTGITSSSVDDGYVYLPGSGGAYIDFREDSSDYTHIGAWTISAWVMRTAALGPYNRVLGKQHNNSRCNFGVGMYYNKAGVIANDGSWRTVYDTGGDDLVQDQWHHLVGSYNGSTAFTLYVDTEARFSGSAVTLNMTNAAVYPEAPLQIGTNYNGSELWKGNIGPCHVYNRQLSVDETVQIFNTYRQRYGI